MTTYRHRAFAYITHGDRLLMFSHPKAPEAGIQVPAGTMHPGEPPEAAAMREAAEETGLTELAPVCFLGEQVREMSDCGLDEVHHRFFFHLQCECDPPLTWRRSEIDPSDGSAELYARHDFRRISRQAGSWTKRADLTQ